jgi:hypothetical protein
MWRDADVRAIARTGSNADRRGYGRSGGFWFTGSSGSQRGSGSQGDQEIRRDFLLSEITSGIRECTSELAP